MLSTISPRNSPHPFLQALKVVFESSVWIIMIFLVLLLLPTSCNFNSRHTEFSQPFSLQFQVIERSDSWTEMNETKILLFILQSYIWFQHYNH